MKCKKCGRELKSKNSIKLGYGPTCYRKIKAERVGKQLKLSDYENGNSG